MNDELYAASFQDGWFKTGDLGRMAEDGYVTIVGRSKDIVIRGGENIPIIEIENIIRDLPEVKDIVIVGVPDKRLGERCHALIVPRTPEQQLSLKDVTEHLAKLGVTQQSWPEIMSLTQDIPRTERGKLQPFVLRDEYVEKSKTQ